MDQKTNLQEQRANCYKLLSLCYYQPDEEIAAIIDALSKEISDISQPAVELLTEIKGEIQAHQHEENYFLLDYTRLFIGPFTVPASPYSSVYLDHERRIMGDSTMEAVNMYKRAGLIMNDQMKDAPDHIKVELEFMQFLILKSMTTGDKIFYELQQEFLLNHLALWFTDFKNAVVKNTKTVLYKNIAEVTQAFIAYELKSSFRKIKEG